MAITAAGVGSGLDVAGIVSQLVSLEKRPLVALQQRESQFNAQLSDFGRLKSAVSAFQDAMTNLSSVDKFRVFNAASSDQGVLTASADSTAAAGTYAIQVDRLAQNHKQGSAEYADTAAFGGAAGDALNLTVGADTLSVDLSTPKTLAEIRDAINGDSSNPGVSATILNTGTGLQRLILTADTSGYDKRVQLSYGGAVNSGSFNFATINTDAVGAPMADLMQLDAAYSVDGYALTSASNQVSGVIDGISLTLKATGASDLTLSRDTTSISKSASGFVDAFNKLQKTFTELSAGGLQGDSSVLGIQRQVRNMLNTPTAGLSGSFSNLFEVGITTDGKTGELKFNSTDFTKALDADFSGVSDLFANNDQGFAFRLGALADSLIQDDGLIKSREDGLNIRIKTNQADQERMTYRIGLREKALRAQYSALDSLVAKLNSTSQYLTSQLSFGK